MSEKYFDFDAAMEERKGEPLVVKAFGEKYELPNQLPFDIVLNIVRKQKDGEKEMTDDEMIEMAVTIFGQDTFDAWLKKGISLDGVMVMIEGVMKMYMERAKQASDDITDEKQIANP